MRTELPTLYKKDTTGKIRQWTIIAEDNQFWTEQGTVGGKIVINKPTVTDLVVLDPMVIHIKPKLNCGTPSKNPITIS